jgi:hypothetical protein
MMNSECEDPVPILVCGDPVPLPAEVGQGERVTFGWFTDENPAYEVIVRRLPNGAPFALDPMPTTSASAWSPPAAAVLDLDRLAAVARGATGYPWKVSRSNGTITAIQPGDHALTVAFAVNIDEEFSRIDIDERDAVYLETFSPPVVRKLIAMVRGAALPEPLAWTQLTNDERLRFLEAHPCCRNCGSLDTGCQCDNDE